jgi:hypothetical protein
MAKKNLSASKSFFTLTLKRNNLQLYRITLYEYTHSFCCRLIWVPFTFHLSCNIDNGGPEPYIHNSKIGLFCSIDALFSRHMKKIRENILQVKMLHLYTVKRLTVFPSLAGMSLTKLSLAGNNLIFHG